MTGRHRELEAEVAIVGGGLVGSSLAIALAGAGIETLLIEREAPRVQQDQPYDGRSSAIARASMQALDQLGIWRHAAEAAAPIREIRVSDGRVGRGASALYLHFDGSALDGEPLGYILENRALRKALAARIAELSKLVHLAPAKIAELERGAAAARGRLADGRDFRAALIVAADGRGSPLRAAAGIAVTSWSYGQHGIVGTVAHELPHEGVAHEHFLPGGPFALLPMVDDRDEHGKLRHRSSLVWTEKSAKVPVLLALSEADFDRELQRRFGDSLGRLHLVGRRFDYPLALSHAERYIDRRLVLVGDAAHGIHPIAGQGLNLGLCDVAALAEVLVDARRLGLDLGQGAHLERYQRWRRFDNVALIAATDGLNRLFSNDLPPLRLLRDLGLAAVDRIAPLKRFFMRQAMGMTGRLPRLLQGRPL